MIGAFAVVSGVGISGQLFAETSPLLSPGAEQRQIERSDPSSLRPTPEVRFEIPSDPPMRAVADAEITVSQYGFRGNTVFSSDELAELTARHQGTITFAQLLQAAESITRHYRDAGYMVARAYVPEQAIDDGRVEIAVLEGVLGAVKVEGDSPISEARVRRHMDRLGETGIINEPDLERGALLLNDLPGLSASVALRPGESMGTSDVAIDVVDEGTFDFSVDYNNYGAEVTGEHRFGLVANANNLFNAGDRFTLRPMVSDSGDTFYGSLGYEMPLFTVASRVGLRFSHLISELGENFSELELENTATTMSIYGSHAFIRSRNRNLAARLAFENRRLTRDFGAPILGIQIEEADYTLNIAELGLVGDYRDGLFGGGMGTYSASLRFGLSDVEPEDGGANVPGATRFDGKFTSLLLSAQRLQRIADFWTASLRMDAQYSGNDLDTSEQLGLGGPQGVRAYRPSEALGDSAFILQSEIRREFPGLADRYGWLGTFEAYGLLDMGASEVNSTLAINSRDSWVRNGVGAGVRFTGTKSFYIDLSVATRLADRESLVDQPDDSKTNFWAQAIYWF